jgi:KGK domain
MSMKISYIQSIINQGYISLVDDVGPSDKILSDGRLIDGQGDVYPTKQTGEPYYVSYSQWFRSGENCKILQPGEQWKEGKIRLRVVAEFVPDEPETIPTDRPIEPSLDTFRDRP